MRDVEVPRLVRSSRERPTCQTALQGLDGLGDAGSSVSNGLVDLGQLLIRGLSRHVCAVVSLAESLLVLECRRDGGRGRELVVEGDVAAGTRTERSDQQDERKRKNGRGQ